MTIIRKAFQFGADQHRPSKNLLCCTMEACSGGERRALARAIVREAVPHMFEVIPIYLKEISGPRISWPTPLPAHPIETSSPPATLDEAQRLLVWWATRTVARHATTIR
jgi:hypothetical protein